MAGTRRVAAPITASILAPILAAVALAAWATHARAAEPAVIVEDVQGSVEGAQLLDYLPAGARITLGKGGKVTLGYLRTCWRETITGGVAVIGAERSEVTGGEVKRERVECDGGKLHLTTQQAGQSGVMVMRRVPRAEGPPAPQVTLYGASPLVSFPAAGASVAVERLDKPGSVGSFAAGAARAIDLALLGKALEPGGLYSATSGGQTITFKVDAKAKPGPGPLLGRLLRF